MKTENRTVKSEYVICSDTKEQIIEADIILPDYYPDISKILKCSVEPYNEAVTTSGDTVSLAGSATVKMVFCGDEKKLNVYETEVKYTKVIQCPGLEATDYIDIRQNIANINYRASGPRKVEIRAVAAVKTEIRRVEQNQIIACAEESSIQLHYSDIELFDLNTCVNRDITAEEKTDFPERGKKIKAIVRKNADVCVDECKAIKNKLMLKGHCNVSVLFTEEENSAVFPFSYMVPFTEVTDVYGISEDDICFCVPHVSAVLIKVNSESDNKTSLETAVKISVCIISGCNCKLTYIDDLYSVKSDAEGTFENILLISGVEKFEQSKVVDFEADCFDENASEVLDVSSECINCSVIKKENSYVFSGSMTLNALIKTADNSSILVSRNCSFDIESEGLPAESCEYMMNCSCGSVSGVIQGAGKVKFTAGVTLSGIKIFRSENAFLRKIEESEEKNYSAEQNVILYYAHAGEKYWDIAKNNRSTVEVIRALNSAEGDMLETDKVLVFPNINT